MSVVPIKLHSENQHYFEFRGKPCVLITSAEHYGAVINTDFNYIKYLDELKKYNFNLTRVFSGTYRESKGDFGIVDNNLAPSPKNFLCPWKKIKTKKGIKYDLTKWDEKYFNRLHDFMENAGKRSIVVEYTFFCFFYNERAWKNSPLNPCNNINIFSKNISRFAVYDTKNKKMLYFQKLFVKKILHELNKYDNLYYEIINEPYSKHDGDSFLPWQNEIIDFIYDFEKKTEKNHLIAQNFHNRFMYLENINPKVSIFNFHYMQPETVYLNYHYNRPIAFDETGFMGHKEKNYRFSAWETILSGAAVYNNLDYSFTVDSPDGSAKINKRTPGFGGRNLRQQISVLKKFIESFNFIKMKPADYVITGINSKFCVDFKNIRFKVMAEIGKQYAAYIRGGLGRFVLWMSLPKGKYLFKWINTTDGRAIKTGILNTQGGFTSLKVPNFKEDIALMMKRY
ncbi:MAG: hypothetical protein N3E50_03485 [Candidatus Goldbacteria bacterium]|nr:hypothetical protein [Candidatus Goldiibacteriota bacterium]